MVLTHGIHWNIPHNDHFIIVALLKQLQVPPGIILQAGKHLFIHGRDPARRFQQALPVRILPDGQEQFAHSGFNPFLIHIHHPFSKVRFITNISSLH